MGDKDEMSRGAVEQEMVEQEMNGGETDGMEGGENQADLDSVMRDAVAAVEGVHEGHRSQRSETAASTAGTEGGLSEAAEEDVERLKQEIADLRDRSVRTLADFDNFRKRVERERSELRRHAVSEALRDFLDVVDNLERAVAASGSLDDLKAGVEMTLRQMLDVLKQHGVRPVEAEGEPFDPNVHEAVAREESAEVQAPQVLEELQRGYLLHERLLRPARVKVAVPAEAPTGS
jgi:molecular chaperone GrpE